ncbi:MAG: MFS transporter [Nitrososphaerales archaeon]
MLRFVQGLFAGGEWASGSVITMEMVPKKTRGLLSGFLQSGYTFGFLMASIVFPDSITHLYRRILCRSWLETNVLYSYWTRTAISIN